MSGAQGSNAPPEAEATAAHNFARHAMDWLHEPKRWHYHGMREMATFLIRDNKDYRDIMDLINDWEAAGALPWGSERDLFEIDEDSGVVTYNSHGLQMEFKARLWNGLQTLMNHGPRGSEIYMRAVPKRVQSINYRFYEDGQSLFTKGHRAGRTIVFIGARGSGKTYTAFAYAAPDALQNGMYIVGNVPIENDIGADDNGIPLYFYSEKFSDTLRYICERRLEGLYTCRLYDEMGVTRKKVRAASHAYQTEKDIILLERKLWSMTVAITQLERDIPSELAALTDLIVRKPSALPAELNYVDLIQKGRTDFYTGTVGPEAREKELNAIAPSLWLDLPTYALGMFDVDINYQDLWTYLVKELKIKMTVEGLKTGIDKAQIGLIIEYIDSMERVDLIPTLLERGKVYAEVQRDTQYSVRQLADAINRPKSSVHRALMEFEKYEAGLTKG